jgi:glycosyltransferase involved in cell wall biosynthesis
MSVVVATRNRRHLLASTLHALLAQTWRSFEIVIADNGSTDGTSALVEGVAAAQTHIPLQYAFVPEPGKSIAVNRAFEMATGDLFALTDDDVRPQHDWLLRLATAFAETGADFVAGRVLPLWEAPPPAWMSPALSGVLAIPDGGLRRVAIDGSSSIMPIGANMALRRTVVDRIGGLRTDLGKLAGTLRTGEDHELFIRMLNAGFRGVYEPDAVVYHRVPAERLTRQYCRRWLYQNGRDVSRLEALCAPVKRRLLGVPRHRWREGASAGWRAAKATIARDCGLRFAAQTELLWFAGYLRERWFGRPSRGSACNFS